MFIGNYMMSNVRILGFQRPLDDQSPFSVYHMGVSIKARTPSHHPFIDGFSIVNKPTILKSPPHLWKTAYIGEHTIFPSKPSISTIHGCHGLTMAPVGMDHMKWAAVPTGPKRGPVSHYGVSTVKCKGLSQGFLIKSVILLQNSNPSSNIYIYTVPSVA